MKERTENREERGEKHREGRMESGDNIGNVHGINGTSMALNGQKGEGGQRPSAKGNDDPGGTRPMKPAEEHVPMPNRE